MRLGDIRADQDLNDVVTVQGSQSAHGHDVSEINGLSTVLSAKENALGNPSANGQILSSTTGGVRSWIAPSGGGLWTRIVLSADLPSSAVANTLIDLPGLAIPLVSGQRYWFKFQIIYTSAALTTGSRWSLNGPAFTSLNYSSEYSLTTTTTTRNAILTGYNLPAACNASSALLVGNIAIIEGLIQPSANGNLVVRFASEIANSLITAKVGSFLEYTIV